MGGVTGRRTSCAIFVRASRISIAVSMSSKPMVSTTSSEIESFGREEDRAELRDTRSGSALGFLHKHEIRNTHYECRERTPEALLGVSKSVFRLDIHL